MSKSLKERNNSYLEETIALREQLEGGFLILAERLKKIRDERLWESEYETFADFLREIRVSEATASKLVGVYEKFVVLGGINPEELVKLGWTNLSIFLPLIESKEDAQSIYGKVAPLDRTDALRTYQEMRTGKDMSLCVHTDTYDMKICRGCGLKIKIHETNTS